MATQNLKGKEKRNIQTVNEFQRKASMSVSGMPGRDLSFTCAGEVPLNEDAFCSSLLAHHWHNAAKWV